MTRRLAFVFALAAICLAAGPASTRAQDQNQDVEYQDYSHARIVRLSLVEGDVQVRRPEVDDWEQALVNLPIQQGYTLATGNGRAEIELESGATIRISENTTLEFTELALADGARITRLSLTHGAATFYANLAKNDLFRVSTSFLEVEIPDNARFRVDALETGTTVSVLKGDVRVEAAGSTYKLTKGRALVFQEAAPEQVLLGRSAEPDEFDRWVAERDEVILTASNEARRYVNSPYSYGLADLTNHGLWYSDPAYGRVWQPGGIYSGWSPYLQGRWVFINGFGWTWVSYEPWGWLPYHFGRWVVTGRGWVWIPGFQHGWHPGLVAWVQFGDRVGWCPLGPRDRRGSGFHRPDGGVVITNTHSGVMGGSPNGTTTVGGNQRPQFTSRSPLPPQIPRGRMSGLDPVDEVRPRPGAGFASRPRPESGAAPDAETRAPRPSQRPAPSTGESGIVYDRDENRFVNNPRAPQRPPDREPRAPSTSPVRPVPAPQVVTPSQPRETPAPRATQPSRPSWGSRPAEPRDTPRPSPAPPRSESPRPSYSPPPRSEQPRPAPAPPPRAEQPRPSPPPSQSGGWGSTPRQTTPPPPPPARPPRPTSN